MSTKGTPMSKEQRENLRQKALERHASRKEAGLPSSNGLPYAAATPAVLVHPSAPVAALVVEALPSLAHCPALQPTPPPPRDLFKAWLRSGPGRDASDTRLSTNAIRMGAELEDRIFAGWQAGYAAGKAGV